MPRSDHCGGAVDRKQQADRGAEEFEIAGVLAIARRAILAGNAERAVEQRADLKAPGVVRLLERRRVDLVFGALPARIGGRVRADAGLEVFEHGACEGMDPPRLEIAAGRCARRLGENLAHGRRRHRDRKERPATEAGSDGITYIHGHSPRDSPRRVAGMLPIGKGAWGPKKDKDGQARRTIG
jgi:hypothetical protein